MSNIDIGAVAEYSFASELLANGFVPCWPSTETYPFDMLAVKDEHRHKIQVKGCQHKGPVVRVHVAMRAGRGKTRAYTKRDVDFVVVKLFAYDLTYIIPVDKVQKDMRIKPHDPACKWHKYKGAWRLLK